jgi:hypothetical protein
MKKDKEEAKKDFDKLEEHIWLAGALICLLGMAAILFFILKIVLLIII